MHLLSRLAQLQGAISKPDNGFLLFVPEGKAKSFTGQIIGGSTIDLKEVSSWRVIFAERDRQASVICYWHDPDKAEPIEEKAGYYITLAATKPKRAKFLKGWLKRAYT